MTILQKAQIPQVAGVLEARERSVRAATSKTDTERSSRMEEVKRLRSEQALILLQLRPFRLRDVHFLNIHRFRVEVYLDVKAVCMGLVAYTPTAFVIEPLEGDVKCDPRA